MPANEKVKVNIHEKDFEIELYEKQGKFYAKTLVNPFGEIVVADLGGGKEKALKSIQARIGNIVGALKSDEDRENRRKQHAEELANKQNQNNWFLCSSLTVGHWGDPPLFEASNPHSRLFYFQDFAGLMEESG